MLLPLGNLNKFLGWFGEELIVLQFIGKKLLLMKEENFKALEYLPLV